MQVFAREEVHPVTKRETTFEKGGVYGNDVECYLLLVRSIFSAAKRASQGKIR